ncbi:MAG: prenyltransferase/squalene oxidase repeat-containing protein [Planctomycetota bacterium]|nr:prenyltransferase/squalene oxidase repeat-containing protein [Planctomycetota bacterium]
MRLARVAEVVAAVLTVGALCWPARAIDDASYTRARVMIDRAIAWLRTQQDAATGGFAVNPEGPQYPAITGLVVNGFLMDPRIDAGDETVARAVGFILKHRQPDGGIYDRVLPSYNTAICLSALSRVNRPEAAEAIEPAIAFLRSLQWSEDAREGADGETGRVSREHPFYGGVGYGRHGRPDNSNLGVYIQALHDAGLSCDDAAFRRALVFLERTQMDDRVNPMPYAQGSRQGGFVYATAENKDTVGRGQSMAGEIEETLSDGTRASRLRAYGSMTYNGFKSMIYANLPRDDQRVRLAYDWLRRNYTVAENPGLGTDGMYYYFLTMSRALDAWGPATIETLDAEGRPGAVRDWQNDLVARLAELQNEDGSFRSVDDRWMENNPVLITAYALLALQHAVE